MITLFWIGMINAFQATLLAGLVWLVTRVWRQPAVVQMLWVLVLVKLVTPPLVTVPWALPANPRAGEERSPVGAAAPTDLPVTTLNAEAAEIDSFLPIDSLSINEAQVDRVSDLPVRTETATGSVPRTTAPPQSGDTPISWQLIVMTLWLCGSGVYVIAASQRLVRFHRALRDTAPASAEIERQADEVRVRLHLARSIRLRMTEARVAPLVWPIGRPIVLLSRPLVAELSPVELQTLLAHELAHLRRKDHWVRWLELAVTSIYWWHPVVWWVRRAIQRAEERACDAWVVGTFPEVAQQYAAALLKAVEFIATPPRRPTPMLASRLTRGGDFKERIEQVMNATWNYRLSLRLRLAVLFAAVAILPFSLSMVLADEETEAQQDSAADAAADDAVVADAPDDAISDDAPEGATTTPAADANLFGPADGDPFGHATDDLFGDPGTAQAADEAATPKYAARTQREAELERGLKLRVRLDFVDTPLEEVISFLTDSAGVDIYLDPRGLSEEGVSSDTPVSISLNHEVSLGSALNLILEPLHLSYVIEDEVLKVTSETRGAKEVSPRNTPNEDMRIAAGDIVRISVAGTWADAPIDDNFRVEPSGSVALGPHYGRVEIAGQTPEGAEEAITAHLKQFLKEPQVQVTLGGWERDRNRYADRRYADAPHSPFSVDPAAGDLRSYVARLHQPIGAAELEILRDHVQFLQDQFNAVDARFKAGTSGGTAEVREVAASRLAEARAELKLAEGKRDEALAQLKVARTHAEEALKAVKAAHEVGQVSHDRVLQAAQEVANVKRKLLHVERATAQSSTNAVLTLPVTARRNDDFSDIAEKMSQASVLAGENVSVSFLKEIVEAKRREKERIHKLYEAGKASLRAARNAGAEHQISEERLRQAMREAEHRKLLVDLAEVELQQAIEAKRKSPGAISELEIKKMMLKLELAKAQFRALSE